MKNSRIPKHIRSLLGDVHNFPAGRARQRGACGLFYAMPKELLIEKQIFMQPAPEKRGFFAARPRSFTKYSRI